jgi:alpha-acetolactate decarboxylase
MNAIHGADRYAGSVFHPDARLSNNMRHKPETPFTTIRGMIIGMFKTVSKGRGTNIRMKSSSWNE